MTEFRPADLDAGQFSHEAAEFLRNACHTWFQVQEQGAGSGRRWRLWSSGGVGQVQLPDGRVMRVVPRVPVHRIFEMWQIAHSCPPAWRRGRVSVETVDDLYAWIVRDLADSTRARVRRGIFRGYVQVAERMGTLRGRIDVAEIATRPWAVSLPCIFQEFSADVPDNQILATALRTAARAVGPGDTRDVAQRAYQELLQLGVRVLPQRPEDCLGRRYHRLNREYEWLHWLSYFVLSSSGPDHGPGGAPLRSFMIDMPDLFERFVTEWLRRELRPPGDYALRPRRRHSLGRRYWFIPDVVIEDRASRPRIVLDMKYKLQIRREDLNQVIAYATEVGCQEAVLVYPSGAQGPAQWKVGPVRVRSLVFPLDTDLNTGGKQFLAEVLSG